MSRTASVLTGPRGVGARIERIESGNTIQRWWWWVDGSWHFSEIPNFHYMDFTLGDLGFESELGIMTQASCDMFILLINGIGTLEN